MRWDRKTSADETIFKAWVQTEFAPPDIDGFRVHLIRGHYVDIVVQGHAEGRGEVASGYWDFDAQKWAPYSQAFMLDDARTPGRYFPRDVWFDGAFDLAKDVTASVAEPEARQMLLSAIEQAKNLE